MKPKKRRGKECQLLQPESIRAVEEDLTTSLDLGRRMELGSSPQEEPAERVIVFNLLASKLRRPREKLMGRFTDTKKVQVYSVYLQRVLDGRQVSDALLDKPLKRLEELLAKESGTSKHKFDWFPLLKHLLSLSVGTGFMFTLRLLGLLFVKVEPDVIRCIEKGKAVRAGRLAGILRNFLAACHTKVSSSKLQKPDEDGYGGLVGSLMSFYVDLCCLYSSTVEKKKLYGRHVCGFVCYILQQWPERLLEVALQLSTLAPENSKFILPFLSRCMLTRPDSDAHLHYLKYILVLRNIKDLLDQNKAGELVQCQSVVPGVGFVDWMHNHCPEATDHLPVEDKKFRKHKITRFLLDDAGEALISLLNQSLHDTENLSMVEKSFLSMYYSMEAGNYSSNMETMVTGNVEPARDPEPVAGPSGVINPGTDSLFFFDRGESEPAQKTTGAAPTLPSQEDVEVLSSSAQGRDLVTMDTGDDDVSIIDSTGALQQPNTASKKNKLGKRKKVKEPEEVITLKSMEELSFIVDEETSDVPHTYKLDRSLVTEKFSDPDTQNFFLESEIVSIKTLQDDGGSNVMLDEDEDGTMEVSLDKIQQLDDNESSESDVVLVDSGEEIDMSSKHSDDSTGQLQLSDLKDEVPTAGMSVSNVDEDNSRETSPVSNEDEEYSRETSPLIPLMSPVKSSVYNGTEDILILSSSDEDGTMDSDNSIDSDNDDNLDKEFEKSSPEDVDTSRMEICEEENKLGNENQDETVDFRTCENADEDEMQAESDSDAELDNTFSSTVVQTLEFPEAEIAVKPGINSTQACKVPQKGTANVGRNKMATPDDTGKQMHLKSLRRAQTRSSHKSEETDTRSSVEGSNCDGNGKDRLSPKEMRDVLVETKAQSCDIENSDAEDDMEMNEMKTEMFDNTRMKNVEMDSVPSSHKKYQDQKVIPSDSESDIDAHNVPDIGIHLKSTEDVFQTDDNIEEENIDSSRIDRRRSLRIRTMPEQSHDGVKTQVDSPRKKNSKPRTPAKILGKTDSKNSATNVKVENVKIEKKTAAELEKIYKFPCSEADSTDLSETDNKQDMFSHRLRRKKFTTIKDKQKSSVVNKLKRSPKTPTKVTMEVNNDRHSTSQQLEDSSDSEVSFPRLKKMTPKPKLETRQTQTDMGTNTADESAGTQTETGTSAADEPAGTPRKRIRLSNVFPKCDCEVMDSKEKTVGVVRGNSPRKSLADGTSTSGTPRKSLAAGTSDTPGRRGSPRKSLADNTSDTPGRGGSPRKSLADGTSGTAGKSVGSRYTFRKRKSVL